MSHFPVIKYLLGYGIPFCAIFLLLMPPATAEEGEGEIEVGKPLPNELGLTLARKEVDEGEEEPGFVNLRIVDNRFQLWFLDSEKNVVLPSYPMAILHYRGFVVRKSRETIRLSPDSDGLFLTSPRIIPPPHHYSVRILLMNQAEEEALNPDNHTEIPDSKVRQEFFPTLQLNQIPAEMEASSGDSTEGESAE